MARMGSYLEKDVALLFEKIGFNVSLNSKEFGFESDVIAKKNKFTILVQTKLYEHSYINVKEILHQWESKGRHVQVDRVLVVISGFEISEECFDLAKKLGIYLWDDNILDELKRVESKELYDKIGRLLHFKDIMKKIEDEQKEEEKIAEEKERQNKLEAENFYNLSKIKTKKKLKFVAVFIVILFLLIIYLNISNIQHFYYKIPSNIPVTDLTKSCFQKFSQEGIVSIEDPLILNNSNDVILWINNLPLEIPKSVQSSVTNLLSNKQYPIIAIVGGKKSIIATTDGGKIDSMNIFYYFCNKDGIIS